jgi:hypothetical protein
MSTSVRYSQNTTSGNPVYVVPRTANHLDYTKARLAKKSKRDGKTYRLEIIQPPWNTGVSASAGTHDKSSVLDVRITGMGWWAAQKFLRQCGWAAWYRYPPTFSEHIHMVSLGYSAPVGEWVPGQVADYLAKPPRNGLSSHALDPSWHPDNIRATYFDNDAYVASLKEADDLQLNDDIYPSDSEKVTVGQLFRRMDNFMRNQNQAAARTREQLKNLNAAVDSIPDPMTRAQMKAMIEQLDVAVQLVVAPEEVPA